MNKHKIVKVEPDKIVIDGGTQMRVKVPAYRVNEFARMMKAGHKFPPVKVVHDGEIYYLIDGFTRLAAWRSVHRHTKISCEVINGSHEVAKILALSANAEHDTAGLPRTPEDKRKAVQEAERMFPDCPVRWIAERCKVGKSLVAAMRKEVPAGGRRVSVRADKPVAKKVEGKENACSFGGAPWVALDETIGGDFAPVFGDPPGSEKIAAAAALDTGVARDWPSLVEGLRENVNSVSNWALGAHGTLVRLSTVLLENKAMMEPDQVALADIKRRVARLSEVITKAKDPKLDIQ